MIGVAKSAFPIPKSPPSPHLLCLHSYLPKTCRTEEWGTAGPTGFRARYFRACRGLRPRGAGARLALGARRVRTIAVPHHSRSPTSETRGSIPSPHIPLSALARLWRAYPPRAGLCASGVLAAWPCGHTAMTRGQCGPLLLHCTKLPFATPRRLIPARLPMFPLPRVPHTHTHPSGALFRATWLKTDATAPSPYL